MVLGLPAGGDLMSTATLTRPCDVRSSTVTVPRVPASVRDARAFTVATLTGWGVERAAIDDAELLVSETVSNSVKYAGGETVELDIERLDDGTTRFAVTDRGAGTPDAHTAGDDDEGGRGLLILGAVAGDHGRYRTATGAVCWFSIPRGGVPR